MYGKPNKQLGAYQMGVQISYRILLKIPQKNLSTISTAKICGKSSGPCVSTRGVEILEGHMMPDHIHLLLSIPPKYSVSSFMGYLKGKSSLMIFQKYVNMKFAHRNREFWCKGYYVSTVGLNEATTKKYIQEQEKHDIAMDKLGVREYEDPFKGSK